MSGRLIFWLVVLIVALAALAASLGLSGYSYAQRRIARLEAELQQATATLEATRKQLEESRAFATELQQKLAGIAVERDLLVRRRNETDRQITALQQQITRLRESRPTSPPRPGERR
jgi:uncharacterized protein HemX